MLLFILLQPAENLGRFLTDEQGKNIKIQFDHGTTTLGFRYKGGVVLAVDSRATGGSYIGKSVGLGTGLITTSGSYCILLC